MKAEIRSWRLTAILLYVMLVGVAACDRGSADEGAALQVTEGARMEESVMIYDDAMKQRHADEADALVSEARAHIASMRTAGAAQWSRRTGPHADLVVRITRAVDRQMRERDMNMNMADERNGEAMGISGAEYRAMREQLRALRTEAQALETAGHMRAGVQFEARAERLELSNLVRSNRS